MRQLESPRPIRAGEIDELSCAGDARACGVPARGLKLRRSPSRLPRGVGGRMEPSLSPVFRLPHGSMEQSRGVGGRIELCRSIEPCRSLMHPCLSGSGLCTRAGLGLRGENKDSGASCTEGVRFAGGGGETSAHPSDPAPVSAPPAPRLLFCADIGESLPRLFLTAKIEKKRKTGCPRATFHTMVRRERGDGSEHAGSLLEVGQVVMQRTTARDF